MIRKVVEKINKNISENGAVLGMQNFIKRCNTKLVVKTNPKIVRILKKHAGIIVANHPAEADVIAIWAAIEDRKDVYMIINSSLKNVSAALDKHLIPVYINTKSTKKWIDRLKLKILSRVVKNPNYSPEEEHQKNIESINLAIKKINQGALVIIFPDGGDKKSNWFSGIGYLIHGVKIKNKSFITRAYIQGTSIFDYLRLLPLVGKFLPKFRVSFAKPLMINKIKKTDPKTTTRYLEARYGNWLKSFNLWTNVSRNYAWLRMLFLFLITKP